MEEQLEQKKPTKIDFSKDLLSMALQYLQNPETREFYKRYKKLKSESYPKND